MPSVCKPICCLATPLGGGIWASSHEAWSLLAGSGLSNVDSIFAAGDPLGGHRATYGNRHVSRGVVRANLQNADDAQTVYIKRQWRRERWLPRWPDLRNGTAFLGMPAREWRGLSLLRSIGLDTAEPLAFYSAGWLSHRTAVVTRAVPVEKDLLELVDDGTIDGLRRDDRLRLAESIAEIMNRIHAAGMAWRSLEPKHLFPSREPDGRWRVWLIDCEGVRLRARRRHVLEDRQKLLAVVARLQMPEDFRETISIELHREQLRPRRKAA